MPLETMASAACLIRSSLTLQANLFQLFQPMGGVRASPLSSACKLPVAARKPRAAIPTAARPMRTFMFMSLAYHIAPASGRADQACQHVGLGRQRIPRDHLAEFKELLATAIVDPYLMCQIGREGLSFAFHDELRVASHLSQDVLRLHERRLEPGVLRCTHQQV